MSFLRRLFGGGSKPTQVAAKTAAQAKPTLKNTRTSRSRPKLLGIVASGNEQELRERLNEGGNPNETDNNGVAALALAAMMGNDACAKVLIEFGANVDVTDSNGWTPLMHAVMQGKQLRCVEVLLNAGANVAMRLKSGIGIDTLANNSTPEIRNAIRSAFDALSSSMLNKTMQLSGRIALFIRFELTSLDIELAENGTGRSSFGIPGTRVTGLIGKAIKIDYSKAKARISKDEIDVIANCCLKIERRFVELIKAGEWSPQNETFRLTKLVPIVVNGMEPWTEAHLTYQEMSISWALG